jgi:S-formylglutathione hydrolase
MGGHGALACALKNPDRYRSLSAFAPISAPTRCPWGEKALSDDLGADRESWRAWDARPLAAGSDWRSEVLVDQGTGDDFLEQQLKPQLLQEAFAAAGIPLTLATGRATTIPITSWRASWPTTSPITPSC